MRIFYSILILLISYSSVVYAGSCKNSDIVKCCDNPKSLECVYKTPEEQAADTSCNCIPKHPTAKPDEQKLCSWEAESEGTTDYGKIIPCYGFYETCPSTQQGVPQTKCYIGYPPPSSMMQLASSEYYCNFGSGTTDIYNVFFTCWLYDCENRLKKPENTTKSEGSKWCYPPIIRNPNVKFCELYTVDNSVEYYDADLQNFDFCVLSPICKDGTEKVDMDNYMPTNLNNSGKSNDAYCETLCSLDGDNIGTFKSGSIDKKCRVIPSCPNTNETDSTYNKFQVPTCLPWCTKDDSYVRSSSNTLRTENYGNNGKHCNPLPICNEGKAPDPPYGALNPYAATGNNCIPSRVCGQGESKEKHFCEDGGTSEASETGKPPENAGLSTGAIIGIVVGLVLVLLIIGGLVGLVWYRTLKKRREDDAEWERQKMGGNKVVKEKSAKSGSKKKSATS